MSTHTLAEITGILNLGLPGWNLNRVGLGTRVINSPRGVVYIPPEYQITPEQTAHALEQLNQLGYSRDLAYYGRPQRQQPPPTPNPVPTTAKDSEDNPSMTIDPEPESEPEPAAPASEEDSSPFQIRHNVLVYPDEPQRLSPAILLPPLGGDGDGRRHMIPKVEITPDIAEAFYHQRAIDNNRRVRPNNVRQFRQLAYNGDLAHTHQGIAFDTNGEMTDGQHRAKALIDLREEGYDISLVADITYNMPAENTKNFDGGATRTNAERLRVAGIANPNQVSPLVRLLHTYHMLTAHRHDSTAPIRNNVQDIPRLVQSELVEAAHTYGDELLHCLTLAKRYIGRSAINRNAAAVGRYLALQRWADSPVDDFLVALGEPTRLLPDSPQRALDKWAHVNQRDKRKCTVENSLAHFLNAYNSFCRDEPRKLIKINGLSTMPLPYSPTDTMDNME